VRSNDEDDSEDDNDLAKKSKRPKELQFIPYTNEEPLSWTEFCQHVFGQPQFDLFCLIPIYPENRSVENASEIYKSKSK